MRIEEHPTLSYRSLPAAARKSLATAERSFAVAGALPALGQWVRIRVAVAAGAAVLVFSGAGNAAAQGQDCGNWSYPVLCSAELVATDGSYNRRALGRQTEMRLGPRDGVDLEIDARDQRGRYFPADRLALSYDDRECRSMLRVQDRGEGRLRVDAVAAQGRCTLEIYAPNNLNFRWLLAVEISADARASYDRAESAIVVNALYRAVLGREPHPPSFEPALREVSSGNLVRQVEGMLRSNEFRQLAGGLTAAQLLEQFYQGVLGRGGDSAGVRLYMGEMRRGQYASVLMKLIRSPEFERRLQR